MDRAGRKKHHRLCDTLDAELQYPPRAVPQRIKFVEKMLDLLLSRSDTIFMTDGQIADRLTTGSPTRAIFE
ncbi:MAG: hypothetical protein M3008_04345 [Chloroflexota bacterium]|nr:hypothetical protein [Chloroflexota bacterium]